MKLNRKLFMVLALLLSVAMATTGTLAYLTDTDADVNVMTLGNVDIIQNEQKWNADKTELISFTNDGALYPYVGTITGWETTATHGDAYRRFEGISNVADKYVTVTNKGKSDAFVRTIIAAEMGEYDQVDGFLYDIVGFSRNELDGKEKDFSGTWTWNKGADDDATAESSDFFVAEINGNNYMIMVATHKNAVPAGKTTIPSLLQVYMNKACDNEEVEKLDGNKNGKYDILVVSQAVQTAGFNSAAQALNEAFGTVDGYTDAANETSNIQAWFGELEEKGENYEGVESPSDEYPDNNPPYIAVADTASLEDAIKDANPGTTIKMDAAENGTNYGTVTINSELTGVTFDVAENADVKFTIDGNAKLTNVTFEGLTTESNANEGSYYDGGIINIKAGAEIDNLIIKDAVVEGSGGRSSFLTVCEPTASITLNNVALTGTKYLVYGPAPIDELTIENCDVENLSSWVVLLNAGDAIGANLTIHNNTFTNCSDGIAKYLGSTQPAEATTVFTNNTLNNCKGHKGKDSEWFAIPGASSNITVSGNTLDGADWNPGTAQGLGK